MEHILHSHVMKHLEEQSVLTDCQHGFRARRSKETQLILTIHDISKELNDNNLVDVALLPHRRLITKLQYYGLVGEITTWVEDFLSNPTQQVVINGHSSAPASVTSGAPQGTVTGPLWFLLYVNDLSNNIISKSRLFADDCILYTLVTVEQNISILQQDLQSLELWQDTWMMNFNSQ